ncbi:hypothetical protein [Actinoallomurus acaciae]|uniref:Uncharacterized protein n=1 Tax=Actinoallomurus acaciae TaxID=502577 RepID=A0ABV5Y9J8_9ACTN
MVGSGLTQVLLADGKTKVIGRRQAVVVAVRSYAALMVMYNLTIDHVHAC